MLNHKSILAFCILGVTFLAAATAAGASQARKWPTYTVDAISYMTSHLPRPLVLYIYTSDARLVAIVDPHGHGDSATISKVADVIATRHFPSLEESKRSAVAQSIKYLLDDAGYSIGNIISDATKYTLILALSKVKPSECRSFADMEKHFKQAIRKAAASKSGEGGDYTVAVLELASPKMHIRCAK